MQIKSGKMNEILTVVFISKFQIVHKSDLFTTNNKTEKYFLGYFNKLTIQ